MPVSIFMIFDLMTNFEIAGHFELNLPLLVDCELLSEHFEHWWLNFTELSNEHRKLCTSYLGAWLSDFESEEKASFLAYFGCHCLS